MKGALPALLAGLVAGCFAAASAGDGGVLGEREARIFRQACAHCHAQPDIGVPLVGDDEEWSRRRERGFESLLENTVLGFGGMPPLGTCAFCSEDELRRLVAFVAGYSELPEPGAGR